MGFGLAVLDHLLEVPHWPEEDQKLCIPTVQVVLRANSHTLMAVNVIRIMTHSVNAKCADLQTCCMHPSDMSRIHLVNEQ